LVPNASYTIDVQVGDRWQGVYRFDSLRAVNGETFTSIDPVRLGANGTLALNGPTTAGRYLVIKDPINIGTVTITGNVAPSSITATTVTLKSGSNVAAPTVAGLTIDAANVTVESGPSIDVRTN